MSTRKIELLLTIVLIGIGQIACIDDVNNAKLPDSNPKLVVQSFITPGDSILVSVRSSKPLNYNLPQQGDSWEFDWVLDATVIIKNVVTEAQISVPFNHNLNIYALPSEDFMLEIGKEYELSVSAPGYKSVKAVTKIPEGLPTVSDLKAKKMKADEWGNYTIIITGSIDDVPNERNFYSVSTLQYLTYTWEEYTYTYMSSYFRFLLTDTNKDGQKINFKADVYAYESFADDAATDTKIVVLTTDEHYYLFHKSLETIYDIMDNPFTESSHLYSNIQGGLGVFASYITFYSASIEAE